MDIFKTDGGNVRISMSFLGANNGIVTGSGTLVKVTRGEDVRNILVDFGYFQGDDEELNYERVLQGEDIDCILLTHAHLDHCGAIPTLFKPVDEMAQYSGKIYASEETCAEAAHILIDAAHINEYKTNNYNTSLSRVKKEFLKEHDKAVKEKNNPHDIASLESCIGAIEEQEEKCLYTSSEAIEAIKSFVPIKVHAKIEDNDFISLFEGIEVRFIPNPHINGATMIELVVRYGEEHFTIVFSGDVGNSESLLYRKIQYPIEENYGDVLVLESLHGTAQPVETLNESTRILWNTLKRASKKKKTVIIPVFALDRSAGFICLLNKMMDSGLWLNCYIDSPLAEKELMDYISSYNKGDSAWFNYDVKKHPFRIQRFNVVDNYATHMVVSKYHGPNVFLTSSCMGYGGRVLDYFDQHIQESDSIFIFPGYLPDNCPSKILCDTPHGGLVEINGHRYKKQCETIWLQGFSAHGYYEDKLNVIDRYPKLQTIFLNHGDEESIHSLDKSLKKFYDVDVIIPQMGVEFQII